jgi:putative NIF3 family GTP cyclohydrolase 1 type 2
MVSSFSPSQTKILHTSMNHSPVQDQFLLRRRTFLTTSILCAGGFSLLGLQPVFSKDDGVSSRKQWTVEQIIALILKEGGLTPLADTVDTLKSGKAGQLVTGIVTTMFPTISVIKEAAKRKANFIIAHEPTFYNHRDDTDWVINNKVVEGKQQLLEEHQMVIWRFHDYGHALNPDAVSYGVAKKANWLPYYKSGQIILTIPTLSLRQLVLHLKSSLAIKQVRIIGDPEQTCERIALLPGAWGGQRQVSIVEAQNPDVLIVGEVSEWETAEYIRDARQLGRNISLLILGHALSEEPGMEWLVEWLQPKLANVKVSHIASQDPFTWL